MSEIIRTETHFVFSSEGNNKELIAIHDFLQNKSRIPMHGTTETEETIPNFLVRTVQRNKEIFPDLSSHRELLYLTINTLLTAELIQSAAPFQVAELGSTKGDISFNLAETLGKLNPASSLCLISNTIGNDSGNTCLNYIMQAEQLPEFSMVYADYLKTNLADQRFDIVLINGDVYHEDHYKLIKEAERITKPNGLLLCYTAKDYLLESCFKLIFSEHEEYVLVPGNKILTARSKNGWSNSAANDHFAALPDFMDSIKKKLANGSLPEAFRTDVKALEALINSAIEAYDIPRKLTLIELKDAVLDYMNHYATPHKEFYQKRLEKFLNNQ